MNQQGWIRRFVALAWILFSSLAPEFAAELPDLAKLKIAAEGGDAYAQFQLAGEFDRKMDYTQAEAWLRKSASSGFAPAQGELGARHSPHYPATLMPLLTELEDLGRLQLYKYAAPTALGGSKVFIGAATGLWPTKPSRRSATWELGWVRSVG